MEVNTWIKVEEKDISSLQSQLKIEYDHRKENLLIFKTNRLKRLKDDIEAKLKETK